MTTRLPYLQWLAQLQKGDFVVPMVNGQPMAVEPLTQASKTTLTIGKYGRALRFRRKDGNLCGKKPLGHLFRIEQP